MSSTPDSPGLLSRTFVCSGRPTQSMRATGCPMRPGGCGAGTVSAITPNNEPFAGSSTRRVSSSTTMQSTFVGELLRGVHAVVGTGSPPPRWVQAALYGLLALLRLRVHRSEGLVHKKDYGL